jgi:hypothetical protein
MNSLLTAALSYAARGWPVLPLRPRDKVPLNPTGSRGATTDAAQITSWWQAHPQANVGIATGGGSAPWVLDLDAGGEAAWALEHGTLPEDAPRVRTGGGGLHLYFAADSDIRNRQKVDGMPVDVRGVGGYVVAPPSVHASGQVYRWEVDAGAQGLPAAPKYVRRACLPPVAPPVPVAAQPTPAPAPEGQGLPRRRTWCERAVAGACARIAGAGEGGRHDAIRGAARGLGGHVAIFAAEGLVAWAQGELVAAGVAVGKPEAEVRRTVAGAWAVGAAEPLAGPDFGREARAPQAHDRAPTPEPPAWVSEEVPDAPPPPRPVPPPVPVARPQGGAQGPAPRPDLLVSGRDMNDVVTDAQQALARGPARLFVREGEIVTLSGPAAAPYIAPVGPADLTAALLASARLVKERPPRKGEASEGEGPGGRVMIREPADRLPQYLTSALQGSARASARGQAPWLRELSRVALAPYWRRTTPDARPELVAAPGLHVADATWLAAGRPALALSGPAAAPDASAALAMLREWLADFPFEGPPDFAHTLALLLTPQLRGLIDGPVPMTVIEAPAAGTGKSLLAEVVAHVAGGAPAVASPLATQEEERRKALVTLFGQGLPVIWLDNVDRRLDDAVLALAITTGRVQDRALGSQRVMTIETRASVVVTANNLELSPDVRRRSVMVRLDAQTDRPEGRTGFRIANLRRWTGEHLGALREATYALVEAWIAAGCPAAAHGRSRGSFEAWAAVVGGVLEVAGVDGFLAPAQGAGQGSAAGQASDPLDVEWAGLLAILGSESRSAAELLTACDREGIMGWATGDGSDRARATRLGMALRKARGRVWRVEGRRVRLELVASLRARVPLWRAVDLDAAQAPLTAEERARVITPEATRVTWTRAGMCAADDEDLPKGF